MNIHNAERIVPKLQSLQIGDTIPFWKNAGVQVIDICPGSYLVLGGSLAPGAAEMGGTWTFLLQPVGAGITRLIVRTRVAEFPPLWLSKLFSRLMLEPAHFIMERKMLLNIKRLAEKNGLPGR